jgi:hypothetical protein
MPDTYGKRQREGVKAKKQAAREDRRLARNERREARAAGDEEPFSWLGESPKSDRDDSTS